MWRRDLELRAQIEFFAKMMESKKLVHPQQAAVSHVDQELSVAKLTDRDNIEAYLTTFERLMSS